MSNQIKILFLAANPADVPSLRLDQEAREISQAIRLSDLRHRFSFQTEWALRTSDVEALLNLHDPQIVHFSGHGSDAKGIMLEDESGAAQVVSPEALRALFEVFGKSVRVVVLNACHSLSAVDAFTHAVDYCIGMKQQITDHAAQVFAVAFYSALAFGRRVDEAFELGRVQLKLDGINEADTPVLRIRDGAEQVPLAPPYDPDDPAHADEVHYLRTLIAHFDAVPPYGGGEAGREATRMRFSEVFTSPNLTLTRTAAQTVADALHGRAASVPEPGSEPIRVMATEALAEAPRLVLLGEPGGGKTVLASHVAVQLARRRLGETGAFLAGWNALESPFPLVVLLREFAEWLDQQPATAAAAPSAGVLWEYLHHLLGRWGCADAEPALGSAIRTGNVVLFFDGLDEVSETDGLPRRTRVAQMIEEFAAPLPGGRVVVTCRKYAYRPGDPWCLAAAEFLVVELDRFHLGQVRQFVVRWYRAVGRPQGWSDDESTRRGVLLYEQIRDAPHLTALAESPLLLTLMARVHREEEALPNDRAQLYDRAIDLLLAEWENQKEPGWTEDGTAPERVARLGVSTTDLRAALSRLALEVHAAAGQPEAREAGAASITEYALLDCLRTLANGWDGAFAFIKYIETRAGLLVARADHTYAFAHRTFQEYLSAVALLALPGFAEALLERLHGDFGWWREVILLAAATLAADPDRLSLLADAVLAEVEDGPPAGDLVLMACFVALAMAGGPFAPQAGRVKRYARLRGRMESVLGAAMAADRSIPAGVRVAAGYARARIGDPRPELRCAGAMPFCFIPAGPFWMGAPDGDADTYPEELPLHCHTIGYDCWIGRFPVTVAQFREYVHEIGLEETSPEPAVADTQPAAVSWHQARSFCQWLGPRLCAATPGLSERQDPPEREWAFRAGLADGTLAVVLPSEAEWEKAARGAGTKHRFPWGDEADANRANYQDTGVGHASVVGCVPGGASPFGVEEASGNVWEWTRSLWGEDEAEARFRYPYDASDGREDPCAGDAVRRVVRGGSYQSPARSIRCASRFGLAPDLVSPNCGFRVAIVPAAFHPTAVKDERNVQ